MSGLRIFISYRREDMGGGAAALVGRMYDRLTAVYGEANVFMDVDAIPPGVDFSDYIGNEVARADVLLAVVGGQWVEILQSRLGECDFVCIEIESALGREIPVIPILAGGAEMPGPADLPDSLASFTRRNAFQVDLGRDFNANMDRLIADMNRHFVGNVETFEEWEHDRPEVPEKQQPLRKEPARKSNAMPVIVTVVGILMVAGGLFWISPYNPLTREQDPQGSVEPSSPASPEKGTPKAKFTRAIKPLSTPSPDKEKAKPDLAEEETPPSIVKNDGAKRADDPGESKAEDKKPKEPGESVAATPEPSITAPQKGKAKAEPAKTETPSSTPLEAAGKPAEPMDGDAPSKTPVKTAAAPTEQESLVSALEQMDVEMSSLEVMGRLAESEEEKAGFAKEFDEMKREREATVNKLVEMGYPISEEERMRFTKVAAPPEEPEPKSKPMAAAPPATTPQPVATPSPATMPAGTVTVAKVESWLRNLAEIEAAMLELERQSTFAPTQKDYDALEKRWEGLGRDRGEILKKLSAAGYSTVGQNQGPRPNQGQAAPAPRGGAAQAEQLMRNVNLINAELAELERQAVSAATVQGRNNILQKAETLFRQRESIIVQLRQMGAIP